MQMFLEFGGGGWGGQEDSYTLAKRMYHFESVFCLRNTVLGLFFSF